MSKLSLCPRGRTKQGGLLFAFRLGAPQDIDKDTKSSETALGLELSLGKMICCGLLMLGWLTDRLTGWHVAFV